MFSNNYIDIMFFIPATKQKYESLNKVCLVSSDQDISCLLCRHMQ